MINRVVFRSILLSLLILFPTSIFAELIYIRSYRVNPRVSPAPGAEKLMKLSRGTAVEKIGVQKNWIKIRFDGKEGWVNKLTVSKKSVKKRISLLNRRTDIASKARKRASTFTSAAAARGLMRVEEDLVSREAPNFEALKLVESQQADLETAVGFLSENG